MAAPTVQWPVQGLQRTLQAMLPALRVEVAATLDSTNSELMRRARVGDAVPTLLVAEHQSAGRGRMGRHWSSGGAPASEGAASAGTSRRSSGAQGEALPALTFSLGLPLSPPDWSGLSLAVGVAMVEALHAGLQLKWPNDIWLQGRKLGGILIETASQGEGRQLVVGVGLNLLPRDASGLSTPPAWLQELLPGADAPTVLQQVAPALLRAVLAFEREGFAPFRAGFLARDALRGRAVVLSDGTAGEAAGVDAGGALLVRSDAGVQRVHSNEVSVRPVLPSVAGGAAAFDVPAAPRACNPPREAA